MKLPRAFSSSPLPGSAVLLVGATLAATAYGLGLLAADPSAFRLWIREDGPVETATFAALVAVGALGIGRARALREAGARKAAAGIWIAIAAIAFFGALEEISWGQRLFGVQSPAWFVEHNKQGETNLHNLELLGVDVDRTIFGKGLTLLVAAYWFGLTSLYRFRGEGFRARVDGLALPIAQNYQILLLVLSAGAIQAAKGADDRAQEMFEMVACVLFLLLVRHPRNGRALSRERAEPPEEDPRTIRTRAWEWLICLPAGVRAIGLAAGLILIVFGGLRIVFWFLFAGGGGPPWGDLLRAFAVGLRFDLRTALLLCLPLVVLAWVPPIAPSRSGIGRGVWLGYLTAAMALCALIYAIDLGHYEFVNERINGTVFEHAKEPSIAFDIVWESYPVVWGTLALAGLVAGFALAVRRWVLPAFETPAPPRPRKALFAAIAVLYALGLFGSLSWYPLRWSHAYFSTDPFVSSLGLNPVHHLLETWSGGKGGYDRENMRRHYDEIAALLGVTEPDAERLNFSRRASPAPKVSGTPNVVFIHIESLGAYKTGVLGNGADPTPHFDAAARRGLLFGSYFVASHPTARSTFALLTGIPDVNPADASTRDPRLVKQTTILNAFTEHEKLYFYTGSLSWGNLRGLLQHNVPGLRIFEESDYASPRNDGWGISDLHLFEEAFRVLRAIRDRPFFAFIQTSGNHPPFTIPADKREFEPATVDEARLEANGFRSLGEYNSTRFLDYALGHFFKLCEGEEFFRRTIFVMYGDHGSRGTGAHPWEALRLTSHNVPLLIYGPGVLGEPRRIDRPMSSVDVLPTLAGLLGVPYVNYGLGRDVLDPSEESGRLAFIRMSPVQMGLVEDEFFLTWTLDEKIGLFRYRSENPVEDVAERYPGVAERMKRLCSGLHEAARTMLHRPKD